MAIFLLFFDSGNPKPQQERTPTQKGTKSEEREQRVKKLLETNREAIFIDSDTKGDSKFHKILI